MKDSGIHAPLPTILRQVEIFSTLGDEEREALASMMERRRCRGGETLFKEGDPSDGLYVVHSGEVAVASESGSGRRILARLGPGECFGEMSLLTGEPRSTSVYATLDSDLLFLRDTMFEALLRRYPSVALAIGRTLSLRLRRANLAPREEIRDRIVICRSATSLISGCAFAAALVRNLSQCRGGEALLLCLGRKPASPPPERGLDALLGAIRAGEAPDLVTYSAPLHPGVRVLGVGDQPGGGETRLLSPLLSLAVAQFGGAVVSAEIGLAPDSPGAGADLAPLAEEALRQSDAAILLVDPSEESLSRARELIVRSAGLFPSGAPRWRLTLVRRDVLAPLTVQRVEERLGLPVVYQMAAGAAGGTDGGGAGDLARIARRLSHAAVGLALGGGGARGLAHIGILEVLAREGVPVDVIGGTSIGSIIAGLHVVGNAPDRIAEIVRREWVERNPLTDFTLPKVAFLRGRKGEKVLMRVFGQARIEDLPKPFFAVAADLVSAEEVVISRGPMWLAIRASGSIPVLLTPVKVEGRFLVDGGVINNVPGDHLGRFGADVSLAVDVTPRKEEYFERLLGRPAQAGPAGRLARRSALLTEWLDYPGIIRTLRRVISISGMEIMKTKSAAFDVCIKPPLDGFDLLDFGEIDRLIEAGREAATRALPEIRAALDRATARASRERR